MRFAHVFFAIALALAPFAAFAAPMVTSSPTENLSSKIATGNTWQIVAQPNIARQSIDFVNTNATDACWLYLGPAAPTLTSQAWPVKAGAEFYRGIGMVPSDEVWATCATTNDTYYLTVQ